jgi:hypothetical protein
VYHILMMAVPSRIHELLKYEPTLKHYIRNVYLIFRQSSVCLTFYKTIQRIAAHILHHKV